MMQSASDNNIVSLASLKPGSEATIHSIQKGDFFAQRLLNLGVYPGESITTVRGGGNSPMVLNVRGCMVVVGAGMAMKVLVTTGGS